MSPNQAPTTWTPRQDKRTVQFLQKYVRHTVMNAHGTSVRQIRKNTKKEIETWFQRTYTHDKVHILDHRQYTDV